MLYCHPLILPFPSTHPSKPSEALLQSYYIKSLCFCGTGYTIMCTLPAWAVPTLQWSINSISNCPLSPLFPSPSPSPRKYIYIFIIGDNWRGFIPTKLWEFKPWVMKGQPKLFPPKCSPVPWIFLMSRKEVFLLKMSEGTRLDNLPTPTCSVTRSLTHSLFCSSPLSSCLDALCIPSPASLLLCHPGGPWQILLCPQLVEMTCQTDVHFPGDKDLEVQGNNILKRAWRSLLNGKQLLNMQEVWQRYQMGRWFSNPLYNKEKS